MRADMKRRLERLEATAKPKRQMHCFLVGEADKAAFDAKSFLAAKGVALHAADTVISIRRLEPRHGETLPLHLWSK